MDVIQIVPLKSVSSVQVVVLRLRTAVQKLVVMEEILVILLAMTGTVSMMMDVLCYVLLNLVLSALLEINTLRVFVYNNVMEKEISMKCVMMAI